MSVYIVQVLIQYLKNRLRRQRGFLWLMLVVMLMIQSMDMHIHHHDEQDHAAHTIHVVGSQQHAFEHDHGDAIDLTFSTLIAKVLVFLDANILGILFMLILPLHFFRLRIFTGLSVRLELFAYGLRPPSRASPL